MSDSTAMVRGLQKGGDAAGEVLRMLISGVAGDDAKRQKKDEARAAVGSQPTTALALLNAPEFVGLTVRGAADVLDEVVESFGNNPEAARSAIEDTIPAAQRIEMLAARGDLGSSAALVVAPEDILAAMMQDVGDDLEGAVGALLVRAWLLKLRDREDFRDILDLQVVSGVRVLDLGLYALYLDHMCPNDLDDMNAAFVDELDMEPDEARQQLESLIKSGVARRLNTEALAAAQARLTKSRQRIRQRPQTIAERAQAEAASAAEDLFS